MATLTVELPSQRTQAVFNLRRWAELQADPVLAGIEGRVEMTFQLAPRARVLGAFRFCPAFSNRIVLS